MLLQLTATLSADVSLCVYVLCLLSFPFIYAEQKHKLAAKCQQHSSKCSGEGFAPPAFACLQVYITQSRW